MKAVERGGVPLITRDGIYAKLGTLTTGSGFALRRRLPEPDAAGPRRRGSMPGPAPRSSAYWETQARLQVPVTPGGRVLLQVAGRYQDYPREDFFGLGPDSARGDFSDFRLRGPTVGRARRCAGGRAAVGRRRRGLSGPARDRRQGPGSAVDQRDLRRVVGSRARVRTPTSSAPTPPSTSTTGSRATPAAAAGIAPSSATTPTATASATPSTGSTSTCASS